MVSIQNENCDAKFIIKFIQYTTGKRKQKLSRKKRLKCYVDEVFCVRIVVYLNCIKNVK